MKCLVIYFSLTGNTEKIARAIRAGIQQAAGHCDILPIKEANPRRLYEYDLIGLGAPVMGANPPSTNVRLFIKDMRFVGGKHVFPFCTHNTMWDKFIPAIVPMLRERGLTVVGWGDWFGSAFGPLGEPTPYVTDGHPDEIDLQEAEAFGREIVWRSQRIYAGDTDLIPGDPPPPTQTPMNEPIEASPQMPPAPDNDKEFAQGMQFRLIFDKEKCLYPKCRLCMDNCPMDGIDLSVEPPVIGKPCMTCMMCDQLCPTGAILVDEAQMIWHKKIECVEEDFERSSYKAGYDRLKKYPKFRQLIPDKEFWGWQNQIYTTYNKHPRFIIGKGRPYGVNPWSWRP